MGSNPGEMPSRYGKHPMVADVGGGYDPAMNSSLKRLVVLLFAGSLLALATGGCQTSKGFGKDVENLGEKIQTKAK